MSNQTIEDKKFRKALEVLFESHGKTYKSRELIFKEGDEGTEVFFIVSGAVNVYIGSGLSKRVLWTLWAGEIFGEMALIDQLPRTATVETSLETKLVALDREAFNSLMAKYPIIAQKVIEMMGKRMRKMDTQFKVESGYIKGNQMGQSLSPTGDGPSGESLTPLDRPAEDYRWKKS